MARIIQGSLICDKDLVTEESLNSEDSPLPDGWVRAQGYIGDSPVSSYFCPVCVATYGLKDLFKLACDSLPGPQEE